MSTSLEHNGVVKGSGLVVEDIFNNAQYVPSRNGNIVNMWLEIGLKEWQNYAKVSFIEGDETIQVPIIYAPATEIPEGEKPLTVLLVSGMHLEEISGPNTLLNPHHFHQMRSRGASFIIIPVINQHGLNFPEDSDDALLRRDSSGVNYNDCWGKSPLQTRESTIIVSKIIQLHQTTPIDLVISCHEDSATPGTGYAYFLGLPDTFITIIDELIRATPSATFLGEFNRENNPYKNETITDNRAEQYALEDLKNGWQIINAADDTAIENWVYEDPQLGIPSILIEGPFGPPLPDRVAFQVDTINAAIDSLRKLQ